MEKDYMITFRAAQDLRYQEVRLVKSNPWTFFLIDE